VYGVGENSFKETDPFSIGKEIGFYLSGKACAEMLAQNYSAFMDVSILRFFFVYGPGQRTDMLIPRLINSVKQKKPILLFGPNGIRINPIYVSDAANAIISAMELSGSKTINVAGTEILDMRNIGMIIGEAVGIPPLFETHSLTTGARDCIADITQLKKTLCYPEIAFHKGIQLTLDESKKNT
jgi:nucleoside-diphosphate-sugar epimerase